MSFRRVLQLWLLLHISSLTIAQIQLKNDEFDSSASIVNWQNIRDAEGWNIDQLEFYNINDSLADHFRIVPYTTSWFEEYRGPHIFKEVSGDFVFTTSVSALNHDLDAPPQSLFSLAGIMLRTPQNYPNGAYGLNGWALNQQNYIFLSIGMAADGDGRCDPDPIPCLAPHFEVKTTTNSVSILDIEDIDTTATEMRVARIDSQIIVLYQLAGAGNDWIVHRRFIRSDFPDTMHIGFTTYTDWNKVSAVGFNFQNTHTLADTITNDPAPGTPFDPDLVADFGFARFDSVAVPLGLQGLNLADTNAVSSAQILSFLGYDSNPYCPDTLHIIQDIVPGQLVDANAGTLVLDTLAASTSTIFLSGENSIEFLPGFDLQAGCQLTAEIDNCSN